MKKNHIIEFDWAPPSEEEITELRGAEEFIALSTTYRQAVESSQNLVLSIADNSFKPQILDTLYIALSSIAKLCTAYNPEAGYSDWLVNLGTLVESCVPENSLTPASMNQGNYASLSTLLEVCPIYTNNKNYDSVQIDFKVLQEKFDLLEKSEWYIDLSSVLEMKDIVEKGYVPPEVKSKKTMN